MAPARVLTAVLLGPLCALLLTGCFTAPPQIIQLSPVNGSTGVAADAPIRVVFDHAVRRDTVVSRFHLDPGVDGCDVARALRGDPQTRCRVTWSRDSTSFTLTHPQAPFAPNAKYNLSLSPGVTDTAGVVNALDHRWTITAGPPPVVNGTTPSDGSEDVPVDAPLVVAFSNAMLAATTRAITLSPPVPGTRVVRNTRDHGRFVVLPGRLLSPGAEYRLTVDSAAVDEHGQHLVAPVSSTFRTGGLGIQGHAIVLANRDGEAAGEVFLTALGAQSTGEPAAAAVIVEAPRCAAAQCPAGIAPGGPLTAYQEAAVSPDGRWVAVVEQDLAAPTAPPAVVLVALPSLVERTIASGSDVAWSPDSTQLAYGAGDGVHIQSVRSGRDLRLPPGDPLQAPPSWSGDGRLLALPVLDHATGLAHVDLAVPDLDARYPVPGVTGMAGDPALSPDGSVLALHREGSPDLDGTWTVRLLGGDATPRRLGSDLTPVAFVDVGTLLAAERPLDGGDAGLVRVSVNSGDRARLGGRPQASDLSSAVVAPSGRQVAYLLPDAKGVRQAVIENADGTNPTLLTTFAAGGVEAVAVSFSGR